MNEVLRFNAKTGKLESFIKPEKGERGDIGPQGPKGDIGPMGQKGPKGDRGEKGEKGDRGPRGEKGKEGPAGPIGPTGFTGPAGANGLNGKAGLKGKDGSVIYRLPLQPSEEFGNNNDWVFTDLGEIFNKQENKWVFFRTISSGGGSRRIRKIQEIGNVRISNLQPNDVLMWNGAYWGNEQVSTGNTVNYKQHVDVVSDSITYLGYADPGTSNADALWQIKRVTTTGDDLLIEYADGDANFDNVWNDRATLSYS